MKYVRLTVLLAISLLTVTLHSCKKDDADSGPKHPLHLHIQAHFVNDNVKLYIDGDRIFNNNVTTNPILGLAEATTIAQPEGSFEMKIVVNNQQSASRQITITEELYVIFNFQNNVPSINTQTTPPGYD